MAVSGILRRAGVALGLAAGLAACQTLEFAPLAFDHLRPIPLDVAEVRVVTAHAPTVAERAVADLYPVSITEAVEAWAHRRFIPAGEDGVATVTITRAVAAVTALPVNATVSSLFVDEQSVLYTLDLSVAVQVTRPGENRPHQAAARVVRTRSVHETAQPLQRQSILHKQLSAAMDDLDSRMMDSVMEHMLEMVRF